MYQYESFTLAGSAMFPLVGLEVPAVAVASPLLYIKKEVMDQRGGVCTQARFFIGTRLGDAKKDLTFTIATYTEVWEGPLGRRVSHKPRSSDDEFWKAWVSNWQATSLAGKTWSCLLLSTTWTGVALRGPYITGWEQTGKAFIVILVIQLDGSLGARTVLLWTTQCRIWRRQNPSIPFHGSTAFARHLMEKSISGVGEKTCRSAGKPGRNGLKVGIFW